MLNLSDCLGRRKATKDVKWRNIVNSSDAAHGLVCATMSADPSVAQAYSCQHTAANVVAAIYGPANMGMTPMLNSNMDYANQNRVLEKIKEILGRGKLISITTQPNHIFVVAPFSDNVVRLYQSFQRPAHAGQAGPTNLYSFEDYMLATHGGTLIEVTEFLELLRDIVQGSALQPVAAESLFSYPGCAAGTAQQISAALGQGDVRIIDVGIKDLP